MDTSITIVMRTDAIEDVFDKWTGGKPENISYHSRKINDIASEVDIEETKYYTDALVEVLNEAGEEYFILDNPWDESELDIAFETFYSDNFEEKLDLHITPQISLDIVSGY